MAEWLAGCHGTADILTGVVDVYEQLFDAVRFLQTVRGVAQEKIYVVGGLPNEYHRRSRVCFQMPGDDRDWYVACFADDDHVRGRADVHPFGPSFVLVPWTQATAIDADGGKAYRRQIMTWTPDEADKEVRRADRDEGDG